MKKAIALLSLLASTSAIAGPFSIQLGLTQPYFSHASNSTVIIKQSTDPSFNQTMHYQNKILHAPMAMDVNANYTFFRRTHYQLGLGVEANISQSSLSGEGTLSGATTATETYTYKINDHAYDLTGNIDFVTNHFYLGAKLLGGISQLYSHDFKGNTSTTVFASNTRNHINLGVQVHINYLIGHHFIVGIQGMYRVDGSALLGKRENVFASSGTIAQKIEMKSIGLNIGYQF